MLGVEWVVGMEMVGRGWEYLWEEWVGGVGVVVGGGELFGLCCLGVKINV